jgi:hypothetical protein
LIAGVSVAAGGDEDKPIFRSDAIDAPDAGAAAVMAAADGVWTPLSASVSRVLMAVPSFVVDELETMGVTKAFKIVAITADRAGIWPSS